MQNIFKFTVAFSLNCNKMQYHSTSSLLDVHKTNSGANHCVEPLVTIDYKSRAIQTIQISSAFETDMVSKAVYYLFINSIEC